MIESLKKSLEELAGFVVLAGIVTTGGYLALIEWRKNPLLPLAGLLFGPVFGLFGAAMWQAPGGIAFTFLGCIAGPGIAVLLQNPDVRRQIVEAALSRLEKPKKGDE